MKHRTAREVEIFQKAETQWFRKESQAILSEYQNRVSQVLRKILKLVKGKGS